MSAVQMVCEKCGARYTAGMVGTWVWPPHVCPKEKPAGSFPHKEQP